MRPGICGCGRVSGCSRFCCVSRDKMPCSDPPLCVPISYNNRNGQTKDVRGRFFEEKKKDRKDRPDRPDRPDKQDRPDRPDRPFIITSAFPSHPAYSAFSSMASQYIPDSWTDCDFNVLSLNQKDIYDGLSHRSHRDLVSTILLHKKNQCRLSSWQ